MVAGNPLCLQPQKCSRCLHGLHRGEGDAIICVDCMKVVHCPRCPGDNDEKTHLACSTLKISLEEIHTFSLQTMHDQVLCDGCDQGPLQGIRFRCSVCQDFDFCMKCVAALQKEEATQSTKQKNPSSSSSSSSSLPTRKNDLENWISSQKRAAMLEHFSHHYFEPLAQPLVQAWIMGDDGSFFEPIPPPVSSCSSSPSTLVMRQARAPFLPELLLELESLDGRSFDEGYDVRILLSLLRGPKKKSSTNKRKSREEGEAIGLKALEEEEGGEEEEEDEEEEEHIGLKEIEEEEESLEDAAPVVRIPSKLILVFARQEQKPYRDRLVGYALVGSDDDDQSQLYISSIAVDPEWHGKGIGKWILKTCFLLSARRTNIPKSLLLPPNNNDNENSPFREISHFIPPIQLHVDVENIPAQHLYKNCGFVTIERVEGYYPHEKNNKPPTDALMMRREAEIVWCDK